MAEAANYIGFVWAAYAVTFVMLGGITASSILRYFRLKKMEKEC